MKLASHIKAFYRSERVNHTTFVGFGVSAVIVGFAYYRFQPSAFSYGVLYGFGMIGIFQVVVGLVRFFRTFTQYKLATVSNESDQEYLKAMEMDRVSKSIKKLNKMRFIETIFIGIAFLIFVIGWTLKAEKFLLGTTAGLILHASTMLIFDLFSQSRTQEYKDQLGKLI